MCACVCMVAIASCGLPVGSSKRLVIEHFANGMGMCCSTEDDIRALML